MCFLNSSTGIDSTEPIDMLISLTSLSNWHEAPVILNPTLGPVFARNNKLGYTPTEVAEINANPENEQMVGKSRDPITV